MTTLRIEYPEELLDPTDQTRESLETLAREALLVRLYDLGKISSGKAAQLLGMSRREFLDVLSKYGVSAFDDSQDVAAEANVSSRPAVSNISPLINLAGVGQLFLK